MRKLWSIVLFLSLSLTAGADSGRAVVIGVDQYPGLEQSQRGAVSDARLMARQLTEKGYSVTLLENQEASRSRILEALQGPSAGRLVVYFAGLGSGPNTPRILTGEGLEKKHPASIELQELDQILVGSKAETTVILDTCFTGARAGKEGPSLYESRYYRPKFRSRSLAPLPADLGQIPGLSHHKICYVTASRFNEEAYEDEFDGGHGGVFTHYLCRRLQAGDGASWRGLQWQVSSQVASHVLDQQHPSFPSRFLAQGLVDSQAGSFAGRQESGQLPDSLWMLYNVDNVDSEMVSLKMAPNDSVVKVKQPLSFEVTVGQAGYLVLAEHSVEGTLRAVFPRNGSTDSARVEAGQKVTVPKKGVIAYADRPGKERLKAFLFKDKAAAAALLSGLTPAPDAEDVPSFGNVSRLLGRRGIKFVSEAEFGKSAGDYVELRRAGSDFFTSDLTFQVIPRDSD